MTTALAVHGNPGTDWIEDWAGKAPDDVIVIDHVDKPSAN